MIYKFGRRWAVVGGGVFNTKEEAYASIEEGYSNRSHTTGRVVSESARGELSKSPEYRSDSTADSGDQQLEQPEVPLCGGSPSETSW